MNIIGHQFLLDFGMSKAIFDFESEKSLTFTITGNDGDKVGVIETVEIKLTAIRPHLYIVTWKEKNGNTISQIQDHENGVVYSNWTSPEGEFKNIKGTLRLFN